MRIYVHIRGACRRAARSNNSLTGTPILPIGAEGGRGRGRKDSSRKCLLSSSTVLPLFARSVNFTRRIYPALGSASHSRTTCELRDPRLVHENGMYTRAFIRGISLDAPRFCLLHDHPQHSQQSSNKWLTCLRDATSVLNWDYVHPSASHSFFFPAFPPVLNPLTSKSRTRTDSWLPISDWRTLLEGTRKDIRLDAVAGAACAAAGEIRLAAGCRPSLPAARRRQKFNKQRMTCVTI